MKQQQILTAINNAAVIIKKASNTYKFVGMVFVGKVYVGTIFVASVISSHATTISSIMLPKYLPFL